MTHLETVRNFTALAKANPQGFRNFWESACLAQIKFHNMAMSAKWFLGQDFTPAAEPYVLTAEERQAEEELNDALNAAYKPDEKGAASDRQFRKVFGWMELTDLGDAILAKVGEAIVKEAEGNAK